MSCQYEQIYCDFLSFFFFHFFLCRVGGHVGVDDALSEMMWFKTKADDIYLQPPVTFLT